MSSPKGKHKSGKVSKPKKSRTSTKNRSQRPYQGKIVLLWLNVFSGRCVVLDLDQEKRLYLSFALLCKSLTSSEKV